MKLKTKEPAPVEDRPYPLGIAWDEAWRQRKRANRLEAVLKEIDRKDTYSAKSYGPFAELAREAMETQYDD